MDLKEVQISEIKNLNLIYIFTTDNILRGKSERYIGAKVVFDNDRTFSLDYKDPYFERFIRRIIERYNKEKKSRNIILLGNLTKKIILDEEFQSLGTIPKEKTVGISMFDTKNYELKKYGNFLFDTLANILKVVKGYEVVTIDKIDGYNNKYVVYYHVGTVALEMRLIVAFRDKNHIDFKIGHVDGEDLSINGTIENNVSDVLITWESRTKGLSGITSYDAIGGVTEKKIISDGQAIYHSEQSETVIPEDMDLIAFYLSLLKVRQPKNIIKTSDYNYILGEEEVINNVDTEMFFRDVGAQISVSDDVVLIRYQVVNALSKYNNQINVTLSKVLSEVTLSRLVVDKDNYVLIEQKNTNEFGSTYEYRVFKVVGFDFRKPFIAESVLDIETDVNSLHDIKRYIKKREEGNE